MINITNVPIISGSESDREHVEAIQVALSERGIPSDDWRVASGHKTPISLARIVNEYQEVRVPIVTVAGRSDALSGGAAARSYNPVVASRPDWNKPADLRMNYFSTVNMPSFVPVGAVLGPEETAGYVVRLLGLINNPPKTEGVYVPVVCIPEGCTSFSPFQEELERIAGGKVEMQACYADEHWDDLRFPVSVAFGYHGIKDDPTPEEEVIRSWLLESRRPMILCPHNSDKDAIFDAAYASFVDGYREETAFVMDPANAALFAMTVAGLYHGVAREAVMAYKPKPEAV